jgi:hypothetical protein
MTENKVLEIFDDGNFISVQLARADGEVVVADYRRSYSAPNPVVYREHIISMIFDLAESLLPENAESIPDEVEQRVLAIHRVLTDALGLPPS